MKNKWAFVTAGLGVLLAAAPLVAHHSFAAEYDSKKPITLTGVVTKVDWMNPHVYFYADVEDEKGKIVNWAFEMGPPGLLERGGWKKNTIKVGTEVTIAGTLAKDGSPQVNCRTVTVTATGERLGAASSEGQTITGKGK
jgi:hypothetical protein